MGWERFLLNDFFTAMELNELEHRLRAVSRVNKEGRSAIRSRLDALEEGVGRVALLARSLAELCLDKGLLTKEELVERLRSVDLVDGTQDRRLQAKVAMPGESKPADPKPTESSREKKARMKRRRPSP